MPPTNIEGTNMYEIPEGEGFVLPDEMVVAGPGIARLEKQIAGPKPNEKTFLFQFKGRKIEVTAPNIESTTQKISKGTT